MQEMTIRSARPEDAETCAHIHIESWRHAFSEMIGKGVMTRMTNYERQVQLYRAAAESHEHHGFLIESGDKVCGIAWYGPSRRPDFEDSAELICIHILPEAQGRRAGRKLLSQVLADMNEKGYESCYLWVFTANEKSRCFYEKFGFKEGIPRKSTLEAEEVMYTKTF